MRKCFGTLGISPELRINVAYRPEKQVHEIHFKN